MMWPSVLDHGRLEKLVVLGQGQEDAVRKLPGATAQNGQPASKSPPTKPRPAVTGREGEVVGEPGFAGAGALPKAPAGVEAPAAGT